MPDTGTTGKSEESEIREQSVAIVAESDESLSCASCRTCPGPRRTPTLHGVCAPTQAGKDADAEADNKMHASSSPSSLLADKGKSLQGLVVTDGEDIDATPTQGTGEVALAAPSTPGPSTPVCKGKRKAEFEAETEDGPVSKRNHKLSDKVAEDKAAYWKDHIQTIFEDLQDQPGASYGRGVCEQLAALSVIEPEGVAMSVQLQQFVTFSIPGFAFGTANNEGGRMLISSTEERHESDPEGVGLDGLDILDRLPG